MGDFSWSVALLSAAISAVVGSVVSLLAVSQTTVWQSRAMRREEARRELRGLLQPVRLQVAQYRAGIRSGREPDRAQSEDAVLAGQVLDIADRLSWWRRWLVRRRLRRLVGPAWMTTGELHTPGDGGAAFGVLLAQQVQATRRERGGERVERTDDFGLMHRALSAAMDSPLVAQLDRELACLADCR